MKRVILSVMLIIVHTTIIVTAEKIVEAVKNGDLQTVKMILAQDPSKLNATDESKYTALHWACMRTHWEGAELLIEKGAKLNIRNQWGMTELHTAIWRGWIHVVEYLLDHGSNPMISTNEVWTAMHYAYRSGHDNIIGMLKERGLSTRR